MLRWELDDIAHRERNGEASGSEVTRPCGCINDPLVFGHTWHIGAGLSEGVCW